ncbi:MAG: endonuclease domain-containing protein [Candidatus Magasanikbacteria bacterium]|nr:endonuclease domain-containing protein [Candidatus Magasanikbacteria bacterium]
MKLRDRYSESEYLKYRRRSLRHSLTKAETTLWQWLRKNKTGFRFRRQTSIGKYIVDFYCHQSKLIIEVDGGIHEEQVGYDNKRDDWLKKQGYKILRLKNEDVIYNLDLVLNQINNFINQG